VARYAVARWSEHRLLEPGGHHHGGPEGPLCAVPFLLAADAQRHEGRLLGRGGAPRGALLGRGEGDDGLETLVELRSLNSSQSSPNFSSRAVRARPPVEIMQVVPCRAVRVSLISVNMTLTPLSLALQHIVAEVHRNIDMS